MGTGAGAVNLVHHHDRTQAECEGLAGHKSCLRHGTIDGVDDQQHRVHHRQCAFDLATKVGVPRGVNDIDPGAIDFDRTIFCKDGDPAFFLEIVRVHHPFDNCLIGTEGAGLA